MTLAADPIKNQGDFIDLLERSGYRGNGLLRSLAGKESQVMTQGTTVLAFHYKGGVLVAGDRRATAGNSIMYERCDKVIPIDDYSLMAIAGVPATAFEMARVLSHNFEYYRRSQLQIMSTEGKVRALSRLLKENAGAALQGIGMVSPIFATFDPRLKKPALYFYDVLGAQFQILTHVATGSGSPMIRGILEYENLWGKTPLLEREWKDAASLAIRLLHTAAQFDSATGHAQPDEKIYPIIASITERGYEFVPEGEMIELYTGSMKKG